MVSTQAGNGRRWALLASVLVLLASGCGGGGGAPEKPTITSLDPASVPLFSPEITLTVLGTGFTNGSVVFFDNFPNPTVFENSAELTARVSNSLFTNPRAIKVRVQIPGGLVSDPFDFVVGGNNPVPVINSISPTTTAAQGSTFVVLIEGSNFVVDSVAQWNDSNRFTFFESSSRIRVSINEEDIANTGTAQITVFNPLPGGGRSSAKTFTIVNPVATISTLVPADKFVGDAGFDLEVNGSGMVQGSIVRFNGANRATTFVDKNKVRAAIPTSDLVTAGVFQITVSNPAPGGGVSAPATFTVRNPVPSVGALTPSSRTAGSGGFTLTLDGTNFVPSSAVNWNGSTTGVTNVTFVNPTRLTALINSSLVATAGTAQVTVVNQEPGGGPSAPVTFTITPAAAGVVARISVGYDGSEADGDSRNASISGDGRWVVFESDATNLVPGDANGVTDIFLRDTCMGASAPEDCVPSTTRVSVAPGGGQFFAPSRNPSISADGRFIAFESDTRLDLPMPSGRPTRILIHDTCFGLEVPAYCYPMTTRFAIGSGLFPEPAVIGLVGLNLDGSQIVLKEEQLATSPGQPGRVTLAAVSTCSAAISPQACGPVELVWRKDLVVSPGTVDEWLRSVLVMGREAPSSPDSEWMIEGFLCRNHPDFCRNSIYSDPHIWIDTSTVWDGQEGQKNLVPQVVGIYRYGGTCVPYREDFVLLSGAGSTIVGGNGPSTRPAISRDARWVVFQSAATNLVPNDTNGRSDIFLARTGR